MNSTKDQIKHLTATDGKPPVMCRYSFKAWKLKFWFRLLAIFDVLFAPKFELTTYRKDGSQSAKTKFDKAEIDNAGRCGLL